MSHMLCSRLVLEQQLKAVQFMVASVDEDASVREQLEDEAS